MIIESISELPVSAAPVAVFCDFDGTVARQDVGYSLFHHFSGGRNDTLIPDWKAKRISTRECLSREAAMVNASADEILAFLDRFELDPGFPEFARQCAKREIPLIIISEGLDLYIERVLNRHGLETLPVICNRGRFENNSIRIDYPFNNRKCTWCGSCKGERMAEFRAMAGEIKLVYAGDGYSDACAAHEADLLLAKKDLARYCESADISYNGFDDFEDITRFLFEPSSSELPSASDRKG